MKITTAITVIGTAFFVAWTRYRLQLWERAIEELEGRLLQAPKLVTKGGSESGQSWEDLPPVVQRYFAMALGVSPEKEPDTTISSIHSLRFSQKGTFQTHPDNPWTSFSAEQVIATNPPGFVWDASIAMFPYLNKWPMVQVCDAWANGKAALKIALMNVFELPTTPHFDDEETQRQMDNTLELGEAMRWLAEAVLVPTSLLPDQGLVVWSGAEESDQAILSLHDSFGMADARLLVTFDHDSGLATRIDGVRPKWLPVKQTFEMTAWRGLFEEFQKQMVGGGTVVVPTHMKVGWINPTTGALELYFEGYNQDLEFSVARNEAAKTKFEPGSIASTVA